MILRFLCVDLCAILKIITSNMSIQNKEIQDLSADEIKEKAIGLVEQYKIWIYGLIFVVVGIGGGSYYYYNVIMANNNELADNEMYKADQMMERDSFNLALNGKDIMGSAGNFMGYIKIIDNYRGTRAANLAHYKAGVALLKIQQPQLAVEYLKNFSGEDELQAQAYNLLGDAYSEIGDMSNAESSYKNAASASGNVSITLFSNYKLAKLLEFQGKHDQAVKAFQGIIDMDSEIAEQLGVDKDIIRLTK